MKEVTIRVPEKEAVERSPAVHEGKERRTISLQDGPAVAFTANETRVYDPEFEEFVPLSHSELIELLAAAYGINDRENDDQ